MGSQLESSWLLCISTGRGSKSCSDEHTMGIRALDDGTVLLAGCFKGTFTLGAGEPNQTVLTSAGGYDIFVARFNP